MIAQSLPTPQNPDECLDAAIQVFKDGGPLSDLVARCRNLDVDPKSELPEYDLWKLSEDDPGSESEPPANRAWRARAKARRAAENAAWEAEMEAAALAQNEAMKKHAPARGGRPTIAWTASTIDRARLLTDIGNAARFVRHVKGKARYCHQRGCWLIWDGKRWAVDDCGAVMGLAKETTLAIADELKTAADETERAALARWFIASQKRERLAAMIELAKSDLAVRVDELDADDWVFNCNNGVVDILTGKLMPHDPARMMTKISPIDFDPLADAPLFRRFMGRIFANDDALIEYVQRYLGSSLTGDIRDQVLPVFHGTGANGKSTLLELIAFVLGDYAGNAPPDLLLQRYGDPHPCEVAALLGLRLAMAAESEKNRQLKVNLIKRLTGESIITARFMRENYFSFRRTFKLVLVTNNKPRVEEDSEAVWRRLKLVPFSVVIPEAERDTDLPHKLRAEAPGVLAWLVRGCLDWQAHGLPEPAAIVGATGEYRADCDPVADFLRDCCIVAPNAWASTASLRAGYENYSRARGERPLVGRDFTDAIGRHGATSNRRHAGWGWAGIALSAPGPLLEAPA